ncbi:MAG: rhomboid family intramembrane serine protease, partial [Holophagales bacterium]|nr:rhomboid family intramembrane serine protease [Holophagales bacterium]
TVFTSMFLHGGFAHLLGNMLFLWIFGDNVEHRLGRLMFALAYLGTGFAAAMGDALLRWGSAVPSVGASGAISGLLGLYFVFFPHNRVRVFVFLFPFFFDIVELPAKWVLGAYVLFANVLPLIFTAGAGGVSYGAHIGGFVAGWALGGQLAATRPSRRPTPAGSSRPKVPAPGASLHESFREALWTGRLDEALAHLFELPRGITRQALSAADKVALGDALLTVGRPRAALAAYQRALADHPTAPERPAAHLGAARVLLHAFTEPTAAYQHLFSAMEEGPTPAEAIEIRALLDELRSGVRTVPRSWDRDRPHRD